jgi:hypothetical protein
VICLNVVEHVEDDLFGAAKHRVRAGAAGRLCWCRRGNPSMEAGTRRSVTSGATPNYEAALQAANDLLEAATSVVEDEPPPPDQAAALQRKWKTEPGQIWEIPSLTVAGKAHRLMCGDSTDAADVERLMGGTKADLGFLDPPYGVDYQGYTAERLTIEGDNLPADKFRRFLASAFVCCRSAIKSVAGLYACHSSSRQREFQNALEGCRLRSTLPDHLGEKHLRLGIRPVQVPARANLLCARCRYRGLVVRRPFAKYPLARKQARLESTSPNHEAPRNRRAGVDEQQPQRRSGA